MDPVSLSLGIAGLLPLIASVIKRAAGYMSAVASARKSIAALISELEILEANIKNLGELLNSDALGYENVKFDRSSALLSCSTACESGLRALARKLGQESSGRVSRLLWPLSEQEHQKAIQELRRFATWMQLALSIDGCRLLAQTSNDVVRVLSEQLKEFDTIQSLEEKTTQMYDVLQAQNRMLAEGREDTMRKNVLDWISTMKYAQKHRLLQHSRATDTGSWILQREEFTRWRDGSSASNVLWCHGIQGSGKTNLAYVSDSRWHLARHLTRAARSSSMGSQDSLTIRGDR